MSLINQMLKDIEARNAAHPDSARDIPPALRIERQYSGTAKERRVLAGVLLACAVAFGVGFYHSYHPASPPVPALKPVAATTPMAMAAPKQEHDEHSPQQQVPQGAELPVAPKPQPRAMPAVPAPEPATRHRPVAPAKNAPTAKQRGASETAKQRVATAPRPEPTASQPAPNIEKRVRPLTLSQRAERLYGDAYQALQQGDRRTAEQKLREALAIDPGHGPAREALVGLLMAEDRQVEVLPVVEKGLAANPSQPKLAQIAARAYLQRNETAKAIQVLEQALQKTTDLDATATLAAIYQNAGRYQDSAETYRNLLMLRPDNATYWAGLGFALDHLQQIDAAVKAYRTALSRAGLNPKLQQYIRQRLGILAGPG